MSRRSVVRFWLVLFVVATVSMISEAPGAFAADRHAKCAAPKVCKVSDAAAWLERWGAASHLTPEEPATLQITDPADATLRSFNGLLSSKSGFKGVAEQSYIVTQPSPANPALLEGSYLARFFVFADPGQARKFGTADAKGVTDRRVLVRVGTYRGGTLLADPEGHVDAMIPIGTALVDLRIGVTEPTKMAGVETIKALQDKVLATARQ